MNNPRHWVAALSVATLCWALPAAAEEPNALLREAQRAYAAVDYESTRDLSKAALERGNNGHAATAELYLLWATAAAALDAPDEARAAFKYALAANPELKLDKGLSPKIRAPYQEARGEATGADGKPPLDVTLRRRKRDLEVVLQDSLSVAARLELAMRSTSAQNYAVRQLAPAPSTRVPVENATELQVYIRVLDTHGNALFEQGTPEDPRGLSLVSSERPLSGGSGPAAPAPDVNRMPYYITAGGLAALGVAAGAVSTVMYLRREDAARDWNGPRCEHAGMTRLEQCGAIDDRRQSAEYLSIGFAATGGALLLGSVVSLLLAPSSPKNTDVAVDAAPGNVMFRLKTSL